MKNYLIILSKTMALTLGLTVSASAQTDGALKAIQQTIPFIDSAYRAFAREHHSPGLAYAVVYRGQVIHTGTEGFTDVEQRIPVTDRSVFRIASMTKSFVAAAILQLRDAGKLRLDDPVTQYIPEFMDQALPTDDAPAITIRHLLTHTSGLPEDDPWGDPQLDMSRETFYALMKEGFSFSNTPGVKYEYSNTPYALLGEIIRKVAGEGFDTYINQHILKPLGMEDTYWEYTEVPDDLLAKGYRWVKDAWVKQTMVGNGVYGAMGGMLTTLGDFAKYMAMHQQAWPARDGADPWPLKRASLREMQSPWVFNTLTPFNGSLTSFAYGYALRWTRDAEQVTTVGHTGGLPGFGSNWMILPDHDLGLVCFSNVTYAPAAAVNTQVATGIIQRAGLKPRPIPVPPILKQRQQALLSFLPEWENAEDSPIFSGNFFTDYYIDMLREQSKAVLAEAGNIIKVRDVVPENNLRGTFIIECERRNVEVFFSLTPEKTPRIQQFEMKVVQ
jgi:Beta-lactamase class C and other penicillin binding proteins